MPRQALHRGSARLHPSIKVLRQQTNNRKPAPISPLLNHPITLRLLLFTFNISNAPQNPLPPLNHQAHNQSPLRPQPKQERRCPRKPLLSPLRPSPQTTLLITQHGGAYLTNPTQIFLDYTLFLQEYVLAPHPSPLPHKLPSPTPT